MRAHLPESAGRDGEEGLGGDLVVEAREGELDLLLGDEAQAAEHADAAVLQLSLAQPLQVEVVGEAERVEANVTSHGTVKRGRARQERHGVRPVLHLHPCITYIVSLKLIVAGKRSGTEPELRVWSWRPVETNNRHPSTKNTVRSASQHFTPSRPS
eukprot:59983-Rhodomonas_salina.1